MFPVLSANGTSVYNLNNSLRFRASASANLSRTPASAGNRTIWTWSSWVKRGALNSGSAARLLSVYIGGGDQAYIRFDNDNLGISSISGGTTQYLLITTQVFRDISAWYHLVVAYDSTQATASNRIKLYVNGNQVTAFSTANYPAISANSYINSANAHRISSYDGTNELFDGYLTETNFIDGQALTPSSFGSTNSLTGVWQPAKYTGTYGTNGFYLKFSNIALTSGSNTGLGQDYSGNGNYWNTNNISVTSGTTYDAMTDVPTLTSATVANYCTLNPLQKFVGTISNANLNISAGDGANFRSILSTMVLPSTGKYYFEFTGVTVETGAGTGYQGVGICDVTDAISATYIGNTPNSYAYFNLGYKGNNGTLTAGYGASWATGDVIGCAVDMGAGTIVFYKNNTSQGTAYSGLSSTKSYTPAISILGTTSNMALNCGQRPFTYTPPSGFVALNTYNLPDSTIVKGNTVMDATLYTGNLTGQSITNAAAFKPDLVWIKSRSAATDNKLTDSVRGATVALVSNTTAAETTDLTGLTAFNTNGFTLGASTTYNNTGATYVGWQWQAGQGSSSSNTNGSITSTVSVNASAGFSIVTYTGNGTAGATIGHGLGVAPSMMIVRDRNNVNDWVVYHKSIGNTGCLVLNSTSATVTSSGFWNNTTPTSTVYSAGTASNVNLSSRAYVAYCWAEIAGFSKFGSYTGNGSADGTFIYTGFRPKFIIIKCTDTAGTAWVTYDTARDTYNVAGNILLPNSTSAELSGYSLDILSNGFKQRQGGGDPNATSRNYIYAAYAESPFKNSLAR